MRSIGKDRTAVCPIIRQARLLWKAQQSALRIVAVHCALRRNPRGAYPQDITPAVGRCKA
jgi:hypothetical protein